MYRFKRKTEIPENSNMLLVCKCFPLSIEKGIETKTWNVSRSLIEKGHDVTILCIGTATGCENSYLTNGVVVTEIPFLLGSYIESISKFASDYFFSLTIKRWINQNAEKFDAVHVQGESEYLFSDAEAFKSMAMKMQG